MAHYDKATSEFIEKIAGSAPENKKEEPEEHSLTLDPLRTAKRLTKGVKDPKAALAKYLVGTAAKTIMEKSSNIRMLSLLEFMNDHYGRAWWDWEPETIWDSLEKDHLDTEGGTPDEVKNAVMAFQLCASSMAPFEHWHVFEKVGHAFNWNPVSFEIVQPLEPDEAAVTMGILKRIQPKTVFEDEVLSYVAVCAKSAGMVYIPEEWCPGVQEKLDGITYEHHLRDVTKKVWESGAVAKEEQQIPNGSDIQGYQTNVQLFRLQEIRDLLVKEGLHA